MEGSWYTVRTGDTLSHIGVTHSVAWEAIFECRENKLESPNIILAGQKLWIPGVTHTVDDLQIRKARLGDPEHLVHTREGRLFAKVLVTGANWSVWWVQPDGIFEGIAQIALRSEPSLLKVYQTLLARVNHKARNRLAS